MHVNTDSRLVFQKRSKLVQEVAESPRCIGNKNKTRFDILRCNPWGDFPLIFCVSAHRDPSLTFRVSSRSVQVWVDI